MTKGFIHVIDDAGGEYVALRSLLRSGGIESSTAVSTRDQNINYDIDINKIDDIDQITKNYDLYIMVGGFKTFYYVVNKKAPNRRLDAPVDFERVNQIVTSFVKAGATIVAPLATPGYLARIGLLKGYQATVYPVTELIKALREGGAVFKNEIIVKDKSIITIKDIRKLEYKLFIQNLREIS